MVFEQDVLNWCNSEETIMYQCTGKLDSIAYEDKLLLVDLKAAETRKEEEKEKEAKPEKTREIKLKEEKLQAKTKPEAKPLEKKPEQPKGNYTRTQKNTTV